ncbi:hypothetical protein LPJ53_005827 [Coemansia erecta]|uniref:Uncharacterized protein n=1 Tax=Coemansia erecta TaxID=147472 RepID=A0A9W8CMR3_9FUNG|nr:hypothetical protein LPJ53_005827 [Coemansia erecta]
MDPAGTSSGSDSDSDDQDGFVKVSSWKQPQSAEHTHLIFRPTISQVAASKATDAYKPTESALPLQSSSSPPATVGSTTLGANLMDRVRSTIKAVVPINSTAVHSVPDPSTTDMSRGGQRTKSTKEDNGSDSDSSDSNSDSSSSCSDEEISDVLDETELQLIEAMEDAQISPELDARVSSSSSATDSRPRFPQSSKLASSIGSTSILSTSPRKGLSWVGLGDSPSTTRISYADSLKERFSAPQKPTNASICVSTGDTISSDSDSDGDDSAGQITKPSETPPAAEQSQPQTSKQHASNSSASLVPKPSLSTSKSTSRSSPTTATPAPAPAPAVSAAAESPTAASMAEQRGDTGHASSVPLDSVEFVAPGVTKQTAMSLLRRVLDIEGPVIQQKMVEFLLIDGVIASLIGFITHCQGSVYSPSSPTSQTAPCSPSHSHSDTSEFDKPQRSSSSKDLPINMLKEFEIRSQHRARLQRQRNRSAGLTETDLRRGFNAAQMLSSRDQHARRVVEAKLGVIIPCLMAVFHKDSLGSFHHACVLLEHCFTMSPLKTTRLLLYQQNVPSRWWSLSESVAKGHAPICDILPYLSEPCVQRLFSKAEFGVWTGRLMVSLNLLPNDAVVVSDELNRMGLGSVASALSAKGGEDAAAKDAQSQQRAKALQLVRNRFQQLNRGGFFDQILDLIEDSDPQVSESVAEFMAFMINDCSTFYGFNLLFKPIYDSELPVRRLAQLIVNSPPQRLSPQARAATRLLYTLLAKTSCQYGRRTREAQGIREPELHPRGSQVLLQVSQAVRNALESFLPGLLATVAGLQGNTDLTSHSAFNRRASIESLRLPEYDETDLDIDTDGTEGYGSDADESDAALSSSNEDDADYMRGDSETPRLSVTPIRSGELSDTRDDDNEDLDGYRERLLDGYASDECETNENAVNDLRSSAAALLQAAYPESIASGSISSSLSPSSTLSASPMAIASSTPEHVSELLTSGRVDSEDLGLLVSLPKPDNNRLNLLRVCVEVLRECENIDDIMGWVDLRVWRALSTWFLNHPHNNILHLAVYQLVSMISLEAVRLRQALRKLGADQRVIAHDMLSTMPGKLSVDVNSDDDYGCLPKQRSSACGLILDSADEAYGRHFHSFDEEDNGGFQPESRAQMTARRRSSRRREMAERIRREEASNCDNILTYLVEQNQWADKLIRRAVSPNFDGAHGYISLILNTLRLAVQVDRRRPVSSISKSDSHGPRGAPKKVKSRNLSRVASTQPPDNDSISTKDTDDCSDDEVVADAADSDDLSLLPDLAYHDPETRRRLVEYPMYRLQRWEITLLYSPSFRAHLRCLRDQAFDMTCTLDEFRLCDQSRTVIANGANSKRPVPFFSPQKVKAPAVFDNAEIKKKQLQINVGLLLGNGNKRGSTSSSSSSASASSSSPPSSGTPKSSSSTSSGSNSGALAHEVDEEGVDIDSLYARMLGFTEDLVNELSCSGSLRLGDTGKISGNDTASTNTERGGSSGEGGGRKSTKAQPRGSRKQSGTATTGGGGTTGSGVGVRRRKSKLAISSDKNMVQSVAGLIEEIVSSAPNITAEAVCALLEEDNSGGRMSGNNSQSTSSPAKNPQGYSGRSRKKLASSSGSVRRRRSRLHKSSSSNLNGSSEPSATPMPPPSPATSNASSDGVPAAVSVSCTPGQPSSSRPRKVKLDNI